MVDHVLQVAVRGGNHSDVGLDRLVPANAFEPLLLEDPENLALQQGGHVPHLVEKQRPFGTLLKLADAAEIARS